jgi:hypothetical protein
MYDINYNRIVMNIDHRSTFFYNKETIGIFSVHEVLPGHFF